MTYTYRHSRLIYAMPTNIPVSPFTEKAAVHIESIPVNIIIDEYRNLIDYDVSAYFEGLSHINIYECVDTKFRFYHPVVEGKPALYEYLSKQKGYYPDWKWENEIAKTYIGRDQKILDIGCGNGKFLKTIKEELNGEVIGLEFNKEALEKCAESEVLAINQPIESFSNEHLSEFDVVCAFQVLEHIADPKPFLEGAVKALKKGGKLIIGVPNNFPYLFKHGKFHPLNMPPHHCGLWNSYSLDKLKDYFGLDVAHIHEEKIDSVGQYFFLPYLYVKFFLNTYKHDKKAYSWIKIVDNKVVRLLSSLFMPNKMKLRGHTIVAVYTKV